MLAIIALIGALSLPVCLHLVLSKWLNRYLSFIIANIISIFLIFSAADITILYSFVSVESSQHDWDTVKHLLPMQVLMLFVGLFWIWIDSSRSARRVVFPAHGDSVALGSDRIEPSFGKPAHVAANNGHPERNPADAIYDDLPPDDVDRNFLLRYWRGKLSLAFSFWTVGVLVSLLAALVTVALSVLLDVSGEYKPRTIFCFYALTWTSVTLLTIWKVVGLWRSAGRYMSERRKQDRSGFWGGVVKVIVAFSVLGTIADIGRNAIPRWGKSIAWPSSAIRIFPTTRCASCATAPRSRLSAASNMA